MLCLALPACRKVRKMDIQSQISALCDELAKLGKASQDTYNPGLWLILKDLLKNWVAKGVASDINDFNAQST